MSIARPFKAARPIPELAKSVAALPYDVMSSNEAREMVKGNPYSFLHVDKAEIDLDKSVDIYDDSVYAKAKENLSKMISDKTLIIDDTPYFYIYRLTMNGRAQTGLVACTSIDEYLDGKIKKHELTREDKEKDRIRHVEATNANTGPIFLTYKSEAEIDGLIALWADSHKPVYDFISEDGIAHTVWIIDDSAAIAKISGLYENVSALYIADGHHRNASAVKVGLKKRGESENYDRNAEFNYYLSVIFPDNQLYIMDYNRLVKSLNGLSVDSFIEKISNSFEIEKTGADEYKPYARHTFGMYIDGEWYKLTAKEEIINENDPILSLDVSILQDYLLNPILGIRDIRTDKNIDFVGGMRGLGELKKRVDSGEMKAAFAMFPTSMLDLTNIADAGKIMPPKSTWFEPKLRSGLFIHFLD